VVTVSEHLVGEKARGTRSVAGRWTPWAVLALAALVRLINLNGRPLWYDEAFAVLYAEKPLSTMLHGTLTQVQGAAADVHPLLYYSILHAWMQAFGQSPGAVRALSALLGVATVGMTYLLGRELFDRRVGLVACGITTLAPFAVYYSQEARMYALLGLAAVSASWFFVRAWTRGGWPNWIGLGVCGAITLYAHNLGFAFLLALDVWVLWAWFRPGGTRGHHLLPLVLSHLLMIGLFVPWLLVVPGQLARIGQSYWVQQPGAVQLIQTLLVFHFGYDNQSLPGWLLPPALFFSLLVVVLVALEQWRARRGSSRVSVAAEVHPKDACLLLLSLSLVPVLFLFAVSQLRPVYIVRALLPSALTYYVLLAAVFMRGALPRRLKWGIVLPCVLIAVASLWNHYGYATFPRAPFDRADAFLRAHYEAADVIVHSNKLTFFPAHYYDRSLSQSFIADEPGSPSDTLAYATQEALGLFAAPDIDAATRGYDRVWFVMFRRAADEYRAAGHTDHPQRMWLEEHYRLTSVTSFNDLDVYEYRSGPPLTARQTSEVLRTGEHM
jgi:4-amino-4-deoxy-L-arabinose transferase-like glycosyltransferase